MLASFATLALVALLGGGVTVRPPPNVVLIVIDDVGLEQLSCYDDQNQYAAPYAYAHTPNIDRLAASGARFTQCRGAPLCSPSRAMLLTGRYGFRTGAGTLVRPEFASNSFEELGSPRPEIPLAAILPGTRAAVGKWHLGLEAVEGGTMPAHPEHLGFLSWRGAPRNFDGDSTPPPGGPPGYWNFWWWVAQKQRHVSGIHATIHTRLEALAVLDARDRKSPLFEYVAFNASHTPLTPADLPPPDQHGFGSAVPAEHANTIYRAQLECLDRQIGLLLAKLPKNTFVFLVGDNGTGLADLLPAPGEPRYPLGHPLHQPGDESAQLSLAPYNKGHFKGRVFEGGIRVPLIVSGPGVVRGTRSELVDLVDLYATIAALQGVRVPATIAQDSRSFVNVLAGGAGSRAFSFSEIFEPNGALGYHFREDRAYLRASGAQTWKVIRRRGKPDLFYDVAADPLELHDLGTAHAEYPATVAGLVALLGS